MSEKSGSAFRKLNGQLKKKGAYNPSALAAVIGRRKLGQKKMTELSERGKRIKAGK